MFFNKKIFLVYFISVIAIAGCMTVKDTLQTKFVVGEIEVVGNEPFTNLALRINRENIFILDCNKETKDLLLGNQGLKAKIFYSRIDENKLPNVLKVYKAEILKNDSN